MTVYTYNNIVKFFQAIADELYFVKHFGHGFIDDIDANIKKNIDYQLLWLAPSDSVVNENTNVYTFRIVVGDLVRAGQQNSQEVLSDTLQTMHDIVKILRNEDLAIQLVGTPTLNPFKETYADELWGWSSEFQIEVNFPNNYCDIPSDIFGSGGTLAVDPETNLPYLTCESLDNCDTIESIEAELNNHEGRIEALENAGPGLTCENVADCESIQTISNDLNSTRNELTSLSGIVDAVALGLDTHTEDLNNPHDVTKAQVGLSNVDNTSDANKPISTTQQVALNLKLNKSDYSISFQGFCAPTSISTSNIFVGRTITAVGSTIWANGRSMVSPVNGTLVGALVEISGNVGSNEPTTMSVRLNDANDIQITTVADFSQSYHVYAKMDLNQSITALTDQMQLKVHGRSRALAAANTIITIHLFIRPTL
jgi:hypothetical protein